MARMKPVIRIISGEIHRIVDAAERELANTKKYYQRGGLIATVYSDPYTRETRIQPVTLLALVRALAIAATWERFDVRSNSWILIDPPNRHAGVLFDANNYLFLPVLNGLVRQPYLRSDGTLMNTVGHDSDSGMLGVFDPNKFSIPDNPLQEDAVKALTMLQGLLAEFGFSSDSDRSAALSALLTAVIRTSLPLAPMFHVASSCSWFR